MTQADGRVRYTGPDWARFGEGDRRGALNYISAQTIIAAAKCVRSGEVFPLNQPMELRPPERTGRMTLRKHSRVHNHQVPIDGGRHLVINDDYVEFDLQGSSQLDSLAHFGLLEPGSDAVFYGGAGLDEVGPGSVARSLGIDAFGGAIVTRGVLVDVTKVLPAENGYLQPDQVIDSDALERALHQQGSQLERGDALLIYVGQETRCKGQGKHPESSPGIDGSCLDLLRGHEISLVASDNLGVEIVPELPDFSAHVGALRNLGIPLGELWALRALAQACVRDSRYEFLLASVPLNITGAIGSPANAVAIR